MPRFFFNLFDDTKCLDPEGMNLASIHEALDTARTYALEMACAEVKGGELNLSHRIEITDEALNILASVRFDDVLKVNL